jgi:ATP-dependent protease Clp ATPase subunit
MDANEALKDLLAILDDEDLIRFGRRAELVGKLRLSTLFKMEMAEREQKQIIGTMRQ